MRALIGGWLLDHDWALEALAWLALVCIAGLLLTLAAGVVLIARRIWRAAATRLQARDLARWAESYANHPGVRAATDWHNQPRKEQP